MSGRHALDTLTKEFTPERRALVEARKADLRAAMPRHALRQVRAITRKAVAAKTDRGPAIPSGPPR